MNDREVNYCSFVHRLQQQANIMQLVELVKNCINLFTAEYVIL